MIKDLEHPQDDKTVLLDRLGHGPARNPLTDITCLLNQGERIRAIAKDGVWVKNTL